MTAPQPAGPWPAVLAEAVVRSRDGRSVLDWDEDGTEQVKDYTADLSRLSTAMTMLEERGFTVNGVDTFSVRFRGPAAAFTDAFEVQPVRDPGSQGWQLSGANGDTWFDVAAGGPLGSVLARVLFVQQTAAPQPGRTAPALPRIRLPDLLLGEVGPSLGEAVPDRIALGEVFPAIDSPTLLQATRETLARWEADPLHRALRAHIVTVRAAGRGRVDAVITEFAADRGIPAAFERLWPGRMPAVDPAQALRFRRAGFLDTDVFSDGSAWPSQQLAEATERFLRAFRPAWTRLATARAALDPALPAPSAQWDSVQRDLLELLGLAEAVMAGHVKDSSFSADDIDKLRLAVQATTSLADARNGPHVRLLRFTAWFDVQDLYFAAAARTARLEHLQHGTMVSYAFLAVTLGAVDGRIHAGADLFYDAAVHAHRGVFSHSLGSYTSDGLPSALAAGKRKTFKAKLAGARRNHILHVMSSGNARDARAGDHPTLTILASDLDNVLVVGGCEPSGSEWSATDSTQGYTARLPRGALRRDLVLTIPHVCATTGGVRGGTVVIPYTPEDPSSTAALRWFTGSGSSQSTPIVAAVCTLIWSAFPDLTPAEVKRAVLAGSVALDDGRFSVPATGRQVVVDRSNEAGRNAGAKRVVLRRALSEAAAGFQGSLSAPLATLLTPPPGSAGAAP